MVILAYLVHDKENSDDFKHLELPSAQQFIVEDGQLWKLVSLTGEKAFYQPN